jgi:tRNA pseudouridine32 synthase/23S rRNA pseudouridine746 synthase
MRDKDKTGQVSNAGSVSAAELKDTLRPLWSDEFLLVVNKPAGLLTIPGGYRSEPHLKEILEPVYGRLWIVHRLDRDTSGVLVLARSAVAHRALNTQFQEHRTVKVYHALVSGAPEWDERTVDAPLEPNGDRRHRTIVLQFEDAGKGKPSLTECHVLERFDRYSLIRVIPRTGRTHQIRAHLAYLGLPILADKLYGGRSMKSQDRRADPSDQPPIARTALHALALTLRHPLTAEPTRFEAPYPEDFAGALCYLRGRRG